MKWKKNMIVLLAIVSVAGASVFVGYTLGRQNSPAGHAQKDLAGDAKDEKEATDTVARVKVAQAREGIIEKTAMVFGTAVASPEDIQTISVPFECRVRRVLVVAGQGVKADTKLIEVEPSPDASLALSDARTTKQTAQRDMAHVQQRLEMKLATSSELSAAQQSLQLAQSKLDSLEKRGIEARQLLAGLSELVSKVDVQEGQIVPAGGALVEVVPADRIQVKLGVEPSLARQLKPGQTVYVAAVQDGQSIKVDGQLKTVMQRINPSSRLVDTYVSLPADSPLVLDTFVRARIVVDRNKGLLVPRSAVLPEGGRHVLFTIEGGKAVEHEVEVGWEDEGSVELLTGGVKPGDAVVVQGNAELGNGMVVDVEEDRVPATQSATQNGAPAEGDRP